MLCMYVYICTMYLPPFEFRGMKHKKKIKQKKAKERKQRREKPKKRKKKEVFFLHQRTLSLQARPLWTYMSSVLFFDRQGQHIQWRILQFTSHLRFHPVHTPQPLVACTPPCVGEVIQLFFRVCVPTEGVPLFTIPDELLLL